MNTYTIKSPIPGTGLGILGIWNLAIAKHIQAAGEIRRVVAENAKGKNTEESPGVTSKDSIEQLKEYAQLHNDGIISDKEFQIVKDKLLKVVDLNS